MEREIEPLRVDVEKKKAIVASLQRQAGQQEQEQAALEKSTREREAKKQELNERKRVWRDNEERSQEIEAESAAMDKEKKDLSRLVK